MKELFIISSGLTIGFATNPEEELDLVWEAERLGFEADDMAWR